MNDLIVGIDLGTTNSLVAVAGWPEGGSASERAPRVLVDAAGRAMVPSVVRFDPAVGGQPALVVVGDQAKDEAALRPRTTIASVKRLMGRSVADSAADLPYLSYAVVEGPNNTARVAIPVAGGDGNGAGDAGVRVVSPQEVSAHILKALKDRASAALGVPVIKAVVTVPAYFDDAQRQATRDAGRLAGLEVVRIVAEPTAAALAYGLGVIGRHNEHEAKVPRIVAVYDFGGGTFDVSILRLTPGGTVAGVGADAFEVLSTSGDTHLGGDDLDFALVAMMLGELGLSGDAASPTIKRTLLVAAERAKVQLSERAEARVDVAIDGRTERYVRLITRAELELLIAPFVERTLQSCRRALRDAQRAMADDDGKAASISAVVMVGGSTRIPLVRAKVAEMFGVEPYTAIDPDQAVAIGAAVQASVLAGTSSQAMLLDVIPLSLGIETVGGAVAKLIMRNSPVPARAKEMFSTGTDDQTGIKLAVYQGEREMAADCRLLGRFEIKGIPPMPAGIPKLQVEFFIDASGVLSVSAVELRSGKRATLQVVPNHGLSPAEVDSIERESFANARDDMQRHRIVDLVANSKLDVQWIDKQLVKNGGLLEADVRHRIERASSELKVIISSAAADWRSVDADTFAKAKEELDRSSMRLHEVSIAASLREA